MSEMGEIISDRAGLRSATRPPVRHSGGQPQELGPMIPHLCVVLPLYNEESCLEKSFATIKGYLDRLGKDYEIILVNDGSTDATPLIIETILHANPQVRFINNAVNRGKGHAVRCGIMNSTKKYIVYTDADLAVPVRFIGNCLEQLLTGTPVVIGSRHLPESSFRIREGALRQFLGEIFRRLVRRCLDLRVSDITCGLKGFEKQAAFEIFSRSKIDRWGYDAEILFLARRLGYGITEVPVEWYHSFDSKVRVGAASAKTFVELLQIGHHYMTKRYNLH
jgi:glycosyltransferase involved in cell wall biosynthesis